MAGDALHAADFAAGLQAEEFRRRRLGKVVGLDENLPGQGERARRGVLTLRVVRGGARDGFVGGEVGQDEPDRTEHGEAALGGAVELLPDGVLEDGDIGEAVELGDADAGDKARVAGLEHLRSELRRNPEIDAAVVERGRHDTDDRIAPRTECEALIRHVRRAREARRRE